jgi:hypothetical protein
LLRHSSPRSIVSNSVLAQPIGFLQLFLRGIFPGVVYNEMTSAEAEANTYWHSPKSVGNCFLN